MGQLAALFSEMADGLSEHPESLRLVGRGGAAKGADDAIMVRSSEWPSFEEVQAQLARWKQLSAAREPAPQRVPTALIIHRLLERV